MESVQSPALPHASPAHRSGADILRGQQSHGVYAQEISGRQCNDDAGYAKSTGLSNRPASATTAALILDIPALFRFTPAHPAYSLRIYISVSLTACRANEKHAGWKRTDCRAFGQGDSIAPWKMFGQMAPPGWMARICPPRTQKSVFWIGVLPGPMSPMMSFMSGMVLSFDWMIIWTGSNMGFEIVIFHKRILLFVHFYVNS